MPDAATYGSPQIRTAPLAAPLVDPGIASAASFGAGIAVGASQAVQGVDRAMVHAQEERDDTESLDAYNQFLDQRNDQMAGYLQESGKNAIGLPERARGDHDKVRDEIAKGLQSDGAKQQFAAMTGKRWIDEDRTIQGHAAGQIKAYQADTFEGQIKRQREDAINDPSKLEESVRLQFVTRQRLGDLEGKGGVALDLLHEQDRSATYAGATVSLLNAEDFGAAEALYERSKDQMTAEDRAQVGKMVQNGALAKKAQTFTAVIMDDPKQTRARAYAQVGVIDDPALRLRVSASVEREFAQRDAAKQEQQVASFETLAKDLEANGGDLNTLSAAKPNAWEALDLRQRDGLRGLASDIAKGNQPAPLGDQFIDLQAMATTPELRNQFLKTPLAFYRGKVTTSELKELVDLQGRLRADPDAGGGEKQATIASMGNVVEQTLTSIGVDPSLSEKNGDRGKSLAFRRELQRQVWAQQRATGKPVGEQAMQAIADRLVMDTVVKTPRSNWSPLRLTSGATYERTLPTFEALAAVPPADAAAIRQAFKAKGAEPTDDDIIRAYRKSQERTERAAAVKSAAPQSDVQPGR